MRKVIVNSTPLIALSRIGELALLREMYGEVFVPTAVYREIIQKNDAVKTAIQDSPWIHVVSIQSTENKRMYRARLHDGEVEVMILAQEFGEGHLVVIDDDAARKTALFLGLNLTGTIGVLIKAKERGIIDSVMPKILEMEKQGIYFSSKLKARVRTLAKE